VVFPTVRTIFSRSASVVTFPVTVACPPLTSMRSISTGMPILRTWFSSLADLS